MVKSPGGECVARDDCSLPDGSCPCRSRLGALEPGIPLAHTIPSPKPCLMDAVFPPEHVSNLDQFFSIPVAIRGWMIGPPVLHFEVFSMYPFNP